MKYYLHSAALLSMSVSTSWAFADSSATVNTSPLLTTESTVSTPFSGTQFSLMVGVGASGAFSHSSNTKFESNKTGWEMSGHVLGALFVDNIMLEAGGGWFTNKMTGSLAPEKSDHGSDHKDVNTMAGTVELGGSHKIIDLFMLGPVAQIRFGTDVTFSPFNESKMARVFGGLRASYGDISNLGSVRTSLLALTDINVNGRQLYFMGMQLSFVVPILRPVIKPDVVVQEKIVIKTEQVEKIVYRFVYSLDTELVNFEYNKAILTPEAKISLSKFGQMLSQNSKAWTFLEIAGHTDQRGTKEHNEKLSLERANAVKAALVEQGVNEASIKTSGFGDTLPLSDKTDETSMARNRRVELNFEGVGNIEQFRASIDKIRKESVQPATCVQDKCK